MRVESQDNRAPDQDSGDRRTGGALPLQMPHGTQQSPERADPLDDRAADGGRPGFARRHPVLLAIAAALVALFALVLLKVMGADERPERAARAAPVVVSPVSRVLFTDSIRAIGTAKANESVVITAKVTETVRRVNFEDGMMIARGDVLVELTNAEESALLAEAQANLTEAELQYERTADLVQRGNATRARLDEVTGLRNAARARVDALEARLADRLIRAPFAGVLGFRRVSPGTLVMPGTEIATLDDIDRIKLDFSIPEAYLAAIRPGLEVVAESVAYPGREFIGEIRTVEARIDPSTRSVSVRAEIQNPERLLRPGMLLTVSVIRGRDVLPAVPEEALVPIQDRQYVFVVEDGQAIQTEVTIGRRRVGYVEIRDGLELGAPVVVEGTIRLRDGVPVMVQQNRPLRDAVAESAAPDTGPDTGPDTTSDTAPVSGR